MLKDDFSKTSTIGWAALVGIILAGLAGWIRSPSAYIADDSYFYYVIARNFAMTGEQSFSGIFGTNGFHPLWLWVVTCYTWIVHWIFGPWALWEARLFVFISFACLVIGIWQWCRISSIININPILTVAIPVTFLTALGMLGSEGHINYAMTATALYFFVTERRNNKFDNFCTGIFSALMVLARLDLVFLGTLLVVFGLEGRRKSTSLLVSLIGFVAILGIYTLSNFYMFGYILPVSGWMKSTFPYLRGFELSMNGLGAKFMEYNICFGWLPVGYSVYVSIKNRNRNLSVDRLQRIVMAGACFHLLYTTAFAQASGWYWYYVLATTSGALSLSCGDGSNKAIVGKFLIHYLGITLFVIAAGISFTRPSRLAYSPGQQASLEFVEALNLDGSTILVSDWPGLVAYKTRARVIAADMLTSNVSFYKAMVNTKNSLEFIKSYCAEKGLPLRGILYVGNSWLNVRSDLRQITFSDPKKYPRFAPIGYFDVAYPNVIKDGVFFGWKID